MYIFLRLFNSDIMFIRSFSMSTTILTNILRITIYSILNKKKFQFKDLQSNLESLKTESCFAKERSDKLLRLQKNRLQI